MGLFSFLKRKKKTPEETATPSTKPKKKPPAKPKKPLFKKPKPSSGKVSTLEFYTELLYQMTTSGNDDRPSEDTPFPEGHFYYSSNRIYTNGKIKKIYFINELPMEVPLNFFRDIKYSVQEYGTLTVQFVTTPYKYDPNSRRIKGRMRIWKERLERHQNKKSQQSEADELFASEEEKDIDDRTERMIRSWRYVNDAYSNKRAFCNVSIVLEFVAPSTDEEGFLEGTNRLTGILDQMETNFKSIFFLTNEYYKTYSPAGNLDSTMLTKMNPPYILTDEILAQFSYPTQGKVGDQIGVYFGTDIYTAIPVSYDLKQGTDACNFLITAETGGGKSVVTKVLAEYLELLGYHVVILDYEGDEYVPIGKLHGATFVKLRGQDSKYFDTTEIGDLTGDLDIDKDLKLDAIRTTKMVFDLLCDETSGMTPDEQLIFNYAISRVYLRAGVTDDPETWKLSKGLSYQHIYDEILLIGQNEELLKKHHLEDAIVKYANKLAVYFDEIGMYRDMFANRLTLSEILGKKMVIFSFGAKGQASNLTDTKTLALQQMFVGYLSSLIANYNKSILKVHTAVFFEELQRYLNHTSSGAIVNNIVTGGRKRDMITFLITNSPLQLLGKSDIVDELSRHTKAIIDNINGFLVGRLKPETIERFGEVFSKVDCVPELKKIARNTPNYEHTFLLSFKDETTTVKFAVPETLLTETELYKTRSSRKEGEDVVEK